MSTKKKPIQNSHFFQTLLNDTLSDIETSPHLVAGIDEAGRGCLAGPVVAAAVILPAKHMISGLTDSKMLSAIRRHVFAEKIKDVALTWSIGIVWPKEIDNINILQATLKAMAHAATVLKKRPQILLIDGNKKIPEYLFMTLFKWEKKPYQKTIINGDFYVPVISAASIIAKTFRDMLMSKFDKRYPMYGFAKHKGYASKEHLENLQKFGPSPIHRQTFRGVLPQKSNIHTFSLL